MSETEQQARRTIVRHRTHQQPARARSILVRLSNHEYDTVCAGALRAGVTPSGFAAIAAINTARNLDTAGDVHTHEAIRELMTARTQLRRYAININQIATVLNTGGAPPEWLSNAIAITNRAVQQVDSATATLISRR